MNVVLRIYLVAAVVVACAISGMPTLAQTPIGGVVNKYVSVTSIVPCDSMVTVGSPMSFKPG